MADDFHFDFAGFERWLLIPQKGVSKRHHDYKIQPRGLSNRVKGVVYPGGGIHWWESMLRPIGVPGINVWPKDHIFYQDDAQKQRGTFGAYLKPDLWLDPHCLVGLGMDHPYLISIDSVDFLPNLIQALIEWNRVVKDGGQIVIMSQNPRNLGLRPTRYLVPDVLSAYWGGKGYESSWQVLDNEVPPKRVHRFWNLELKHMLRIIFYVNLYMASVQNDDKTWSQAKIEPFEVVCEEEKDESHEDCWLIILNNHRAEKLRKPILRGRLLLAEEGNRNRGDKEDDAEESGVGSVPSNL